jgi:anti-sigma regulatory factor (Ser/Thr protein kinase)
VVSDPGISGQMFLHDSALVGWRPGDDLRMTDPLAPCVNARARLVALCLMDLQPDAGLFRVSSLQSARGDVQGADNILTALVLLRARVPSGMASLGVIVSWRLEMREELEAITGNKAQQAVQIAREGLANVVRHAKASRVEVVCRYLPERHDMLLEVRDNGCSMSRPAAAGVAGPRRTRRRSAGLQAKRAGACQLGGDLSVASTPGQGTRVRLTLALARR